MSRRSKLGACSARRNKMHIQASEATHCRLKRLVQSLRDLPPLAELLINNHMLLMLTYKKAYSRQIKKENGYKLFKISIEAMKPR